MKLAMQNGQTKIATNYRETRDKSYDSSIEIGNDRWE